MPLILVTGLPSSGKTKISHELSKYLQAKLKEENRSDHVRIVSDGDNLDWEGRDLIYMNAAKEKELRAWLRAEAQRYINLNQIVILDSAAYIKGFRYELFCMSKEARTQFCVVENILDPDTCWKFNQARQEAYRDLKDRDPDEPEPGYTRETFDAIIARYEKCDESNRWDSPLFKLTTENDRLDMDKVYRIITEDEPLIPNKATVLVSSTTTRFRPVNKPEIMRPEDEQVSHGRID